MELMDVINDAYKFSDFLHSTQEYRKLKEAEYNMIKDENLKILFDNYQFLQEKYDNYQNDDNKKKMFECKYKIDTHPLVIEYNDNLKKYNLLLLNIKKIIFHNLINEDDLVFRVADTLK